MKPDKELTTHGIGLALVLLALFAVPLLSIPFFARVLVFLLPCASILGVLFFANATFSSGVALRFFIKVYRSNGAREFYWTGVISTLAVGTLACFSIAASLLTWQRSAA